MGWNQVSIIKKTSLVKNINNKFRFYFVHSYHEELKNSSESIMSTDYGKDFTSGLQSENIMGVQFHPEKSHKYGMQILKNFVKNKVIRNRVIPALLLKITLWLKRSTLPNQVTLVIQLTLLEYLMNF